MIVIVMMVRVLLAIMMMPGINGRRQHVVEMRLGGEMDGDKVDVEREQKCGIQTATPTRFTG